MHEGDVEGGDAETHTANIEARKREAFIIGASQLVTHASTGPTGDCLASEVGRAQAGPITYERRQINCGDHVIQTMQRNRYGAASWARCGVGGVGCTCTRGGVHMSATRAKTVQQVSRCAAGFSEAARLR